MIHYGLADTNNFEKCTSQIPLLNPAVIEKQFQNVDGIFQCFSRKYAINEKGLSDESETLFRGAFLFVQQLVKVMVCTDFVEDMHDRCMDFLSL